METFNESPTLSNYKLPLLFGLTGWTAGLFLVVKLWSINHPGEIWKYSGAILFAIWGIPFSVRYWPRWTRIEISDEGIQRTKARCYLFFPFLLSIPQWLIPEFLLPVCRREFFLDWADLKAWSVTNFIAERNRETFHRSLLMEVSVDTQKKTFLQNYHPAIQVESHAGDIWYLFIPVADAARAFSQYVPEKQTNRLDESDTE